MLPAQEETKVERDGTGTRDRPGLASGRGLVHRSGDRLDAALCWEMMSELVKV